MPVAVSPRESKIQKRLLEDINIQDTRYSFRLKDLGQLLIIKHELKTDGQKEPILVEETKTGQLRVLDGFQRIQAALELQSQSVKWKELKCTVIKADETTDAERFRLLRQKNFSGAFAYGLFDKCRFLRNFADRGISLEIMHSETGIPFHDLEDMLDLSDASPTLGTLLNHTKAAPVFSVMLYRRYSGWVKTPYKKHAGLIAKTLLQIPGKEKITMKAWRFYLDFYWADDRPAMLL